MNTTPRTDAEWQSIIASAPWDAAAEQIAQHARQLERELAAKDAHADEIYKASVDLAAKLEDDLAACREWSSKLADVADNLRADLATANDQLAANHEATRLMGKWLEDERELADRLLAIAEKAVSDHEGTLHCDCDCKCSGRRIANDNAEALASWMEARK
jgi:hypothetical protein